MPRSTTAAVHLLVHTVEVFVDAVQKEAHELARVVLLVAREHRGVLRHHLLQGVGYHHRILSRPRLRRDKFRGPPNTSAETGKLDLLKTIPTTLTNSTNRALRAWRGETTQTEACSTRCEPLAQRHWAAVPRDTDSALWITRRSREDRGSARAHSRALRAQTKRGYSWPRLLQGAYSLN